MNDGIDAKVRSRHPGESTVTSAVSTESKRKVPRLTMAEAGEIPVDQLVRFAIREGRRPRPIYTAHKWFARRLASVFRSLLIGVTEPPGADFDTLYYGAANLRGVSVLDPFVGGGTSVFEASRLGATAYGCDVDPVACAVSRMELGAANMPDLSQALADLTTTVGEQMARYHRSGDRTVLHHFWVQTVECSDCSKSFDAHPSFVLSDDGTTCHSICKHCGEILSAKSGTTQVHCPSCGGITEPDDGNSIKGKAKCPSCGHIEPLIGIARREGRPTWRLFALETITPAKDRRVVPIAERSFQRASEADIALYAEAEIALEEGIKSGAISLPGDDIDAAGWSDDRLPSYGYRKWCDLFNARQLLHLSLLAKAIRGLEEPVRSAISMAFSDHLTTNCMMASYAHGWRRLTPLFSVRAFRHIQRPVELNPWMDRTGRGSFPNSVRKLAQAAAYARKPKEPRGEKAFVDVAPVAARRHGSIHLGSARNLPFLTDGSIDVVITDPPYFDNIAYSELAQFFAPWLKELGVIEEIPRSSILAESLVANQAQEESVGRYTEGLADAFREISRVLRPQGIVAFSFRHTEAPAWLALAKAIAATDLHITAVLPMPGEVGMGLHALGERGLWDAVFILRRGRRQFGDQLQVTTEDITEVEQRVASWKAGYGSLAIPFNDIDATALRRAALVGKALRKKTVSRGKTATLEACLAPTANIGETPKCRKLISAS